MLLAAIFTEEHVTTHPTGRPDPANRLSTVVPAAAPHPAVDQGELCEDTAHFPAEEARYEERSISHTSSHRHSTPVAAATMLILMQACHGARLYKCVRLISLRFFPRTHRLFIGFKLNGVICHFLRLLIELG